MVGQKILAALKARGTSLGKWAEERGFKREIAYHAVRHWAGRDRAPLGGISRQIMSSLRADLGIDWTAAVPTVARRPRPTPPSPPPAGGRLSKSTAQ